MKVEGKTIVVTGGGNGIGRELVLNLLDRGARVAAVDINEAALNETGNLAGSRAERLSVHVMNITDEKAVARLPEEVAAIHGSVDGLINNAGIIQPFVRLRDLNFEVAEKVMDVNFFGTLYMVKAFLATFRNRPEAHIVNVSSMGGFLPVPGQCVYGASKAAVKMLTEGLYAGLLGTGVRVSIVFPGAIATEITRNSGVEAPGSGKRDVDSSKFNPMPAAEAAKDIIDGMEKNKVRILVGKDSKFLNLLYRISPGYATRFISKQMKSLLPD
ncbi:MAG: SDR family NAD(P)-dependent oxidoreductase [Bacteroidales bacterium]|nr:SDR family NAD(P)-dependent oxidoreductase [Bacteroidales bacterium]